MQEYSIAASVRDLVDVIDALVANAWIPMRDVLPAYHLYGQSFGGILAFEALTTVSGLPVPRSLTLSNTPSSVPLLLEDVAALLADLGGDSSSFDATHVCRAMPRPPALVAAYAQGHPGTHWRGVDVIADWFASETKLGSLNQPVLILAAEHDFVTLRSMQGWQTLAKQHLVGSLGVYAETTLAVSSASLSSFTGGIGGGATLDVSKYLQFDYGLSRGLGNRATDWINVLRVRWQF